MSGHSDQAFPTRQEPELRPQNPGPLAGLDRRKPKELNQPVQLIVEGADAWGFWTGMVRRLGLTGIQVHDFGGVSELAPYLAVVRGLPGFDTVVRVLCVGRDAETDAQAALQSVQAALERAGLPVPRRPLTLEGGDPAVAVMIWPAPEHPPGSRVWTGRGTLEDLCLACVPGSRLQCADAFLRCVEESGGRLVRRHKSRLQAYLAGTEHAGRTLCDATAAGAWPIDAEPLAPFIHLLRSAVEAARG